MTQQQKDECKNKGKDPEVGPFLAFAFSNVLHVEQMWSLLFFFAFLMHLQMECKNYIRILHKTKDDKMYVCGTNAFDPECDYMVRQTQSHGAQLSQFIFHTV